MSQTLEISFQFITQLNSKQLMQLKYRLGSWDKRAVVLSIVEFLFSFWKEDLSSKAQSCLSCVIMTLTG